MEEQKQIQPLVERSKYRSSFGATLLFSGVQVYQIIVRVIRSKFVAMFLGPEGMGIMSLLHTTTDLISTSTNLGLKTSGVKSVAAANSSHDEEKVSQITFVLRRLILLTGLIGTLICALGAPLWSDISFGNSDYQWSFVVVSIIILLDQLTNGEQVLLQGLQKKKYLARASIIGQTIGLFVAVPLYYYYHNDAIVWVLVIHSITAYCISLYFTRKIKFKSSFLSFNEVLTQGGGMIKLGFFLSLQSILSMLSLYLVRSFVSYTGGLEDVGLYGAGVTIITVYLGLVFSAISTDYFPRLASTKTNTELCESVNQQAEITILLLAPVIVAFVVFIRPVILLLYSDKFLPIEDMLYWAMSATLLKAMAWSLSHSILAKVSPKVFFYNELFAMVISFTSNILGYYYWGLTGFGISMLFVYFIYMIQMLVVTRRLFNMIIPFKTWYIFFILNVLVVAALTAKMIHVSWFNYLFGIIVLIITSVYCLKELDNRMDLKSYLASRIK